MAALLKERARKPIIPAESGIAFPGFKHVSGTNYYVLEVREPWAQDGYQVFQILLTEKEMLRATSEWLQLVARER